MPLGLILGVALALMACVSILLAWPQALSCALIIASVSFFLRDYYLLKLAREQSGEEGE